MRLDRNQRGKRRADRAGMLRNAIVAGGIALNVILSFAVHRLGLPLYLDTVGTLLVAWECGPLAAVITALASNMLCIPFSRMSAYFAIINIAMAVSASRMFDTEIY